MHAYLQTYIHTYVYACDSRGLISSEGTLASTEKVNYSLQTLSLEGSEERREGRKRDRGSVFFA